MFEKLSDKFSKVFQKLRGRTRLSEADLKETLREVRLSLLEADVNYKVVKDFLATLSQKTLGMEVQRNLTPSQQIIKVIYDELAEMMGGDFVGLDLSGRPPWPIMLVGLQGSGKTTTAGKLALYLKKQGHSPYLVPADVARPAAIAQLARLGQDLGIPVHPSESGMTPVSIAEASLAAAGMAGCDAILLDTAGRLSIDQELMRELAEIKAVTRSVEILLVADAMTGQEAVNIASEFNKRLDLTGVILTKMEGDARGGAAMSIRAVTDKPLKFIGVGEKPEALEPFHPDRMASLILGMGDVLSLIEKAQETMTEEDANNITSRVMKGSFSLDDFRKQLTALSKMGSLESFIGMIPGLGKLKKLKEAKPDPAQLVKITAIIDSMTFEERRDHLIIDASRRRRIALGSGTTVQDVNKLLKNFTDVVKTMKMASRSGGIEALGRRLFGNADFLS
ncbi:MAG: signal recognition particle protein [Deltaproteobacteria bacterium]|jgi:signal recognition particle subunit SRP54|nr:signal recognition particle protein [Deltaproteobacteria bacterium]